MGTYEIKEKVKVALDKLERSLLNFEREFPVKETPKEYSKEHEELYKDLLNLYGNTKEFTKYIVRERGKYKRETKKLKGLMGE